MKPYSRLSIFLLLFTMSSSASTIVEANTPPQNPIMYGWVGYSQLSDLAPRSNHDAYMTLLKRDLDQATPRLQEELTQNPNSLSAYVGLMQAQRTQWPEVTKRLRVRLAQQRHAHQELNSIDLFKLGTVLYYQWGQQPPPPTDYRTLAEAQTLLASAWQKDHDPIVGLMFGEALGVGMYPGRPTFNGWTLASIDQQLMRELAGHTAFTEYNIARVSNWNTQVPSISSVPAQNLRPLLAVVASLRSISDGRTGRLIVINGKPTMIDDPIPPLQLAQARYLKQWYDNLVKATAA